MQWPPQKFAQTQSSGASFPSEPPYEVVKRLKSCYYTVLPPFHCPVWQHLWKVYGELVWCDRSMKSLTYHNISSSYGSINITEINVHPWIILSYNIHKTKSWIHQHNNHFYWSMLVNVVIWSWQHSRSNMHLDLGTSWISNIKLEFIKKKYTV